MVVLVVLAIALLITLGLVLIDVVFGRRPDPLHTDREERWLVRHAPGWARPALRAADRRVAGGAITVVSFAVLLAGAAFVGWVLDMVDRKEGFARWDRSAAKWGAEHATHRSTTVLKAITQFGGTTVVTIALLAVGLALVRSRGWGVLGYLAVVGIGVTALNNLLKVLIHRERPDILLLVRHTGYSFPSGHSAASAACWAAIAVAVFGRSSRRTRALAATGAVFIAVAVATSRVLLGVHWLTDVIAGLAVGWSWFLLCTIVFGGPWLRFGAPVERVPVEAPA